MNPEALAEFEFLKSVTIKSGTVGKLILKIPWSNLKVRIKLKKNKLIDSIDRMKQFV